MQISALISGPNINFDYQLTALARTLVNPGVISGLAVSAGSVAVGEAFILCERTNGQKIMVHYSNTQSVTIDTTGTKKVWIAVSQATINDGSQNALDGTGIATIQTGANYPSANYIPLASITSGTITDARVMISGKPILRKGLTAQKVYVSDASGNEAPLALANGQVVGMDGGIIKGISPSVNIGGLTETTTLANTDEFIINNGGTNKKVKYENIKQIIQNVGTTFNYQEGTVNNWTTNSIAVPKGGFFSVACKTPEGSPSHSITVQKSTDNSTWTSIVSGGGYVGSLSGFCPPGYVRALVNTSISMSKSFTVQIFQ